SKTLGLALGSGGARGIVHAGFLGALDAEGSKADYITGCSMGSVVGGCYASGLTAKEIRDTFLSLKFFDLFDFSPGALMKMALLRSKKIYDLLAENLKVANIENFPIPFKCVATDLLSGKLHVFSKGDAALAIEASSTIPGVFRPVQFEDKLLVDGGCLCRVPFQLVKEMGAEVVVAVDALVNTSEHVEKVNNMVSMLLRVFDVMDWHASSILKERDKHLYDLWLEPQLKGVTAYQVKELEGIYDEGYDLGRKNLQKIKELLK
ncbi:MAG: patatin-like phospholipase family protein, partial [Clostridia bacterium]|nr:patatin-like phospholipase family protein [Clostridia bacterium]